MGQHGGESGRAGEETHPSDRGRAGDAEDGRIRTEPEEGGGVAREDDTLSGRLSQHPHAARGHCGRAGQL